jgi:glycosyltransferase involved in cell wall biosynthesis
VKLHPLPFDRKIGYFLNASALKRLIKAVGPDLLHIHYASGYGTLGRRTGFKPAILSVWGSDVHEFPQISSFAHRLVRKNLNHADLILATSHFLADEVKKLVCPFGEIEVVPFGVDTDRFKPGHTIKDSNKQITIGTVKGLSYKYGIDILLKGFALAKQYLRDGDDPFYMDLKLVVVGAGREKNRLVRMAGSMAITEHVQFTGFVAHASIPEYLRGMDIFVNVSRQEGFGVSVLEASASSLPVVVANVGGASEVVEHGSTGLLIPAENPEELARALTRLIQNSESRSAMGAAGRKMVETRFGWQECVAHMNNLYLRMVGNGK